MLLLPHGHLLFELLALSIPQRPLLEQLIHLQPIDRRKLQVGQPGSGTFGFQALGGTRLLQVVLQQ